MSKFDPEWLCLKFPKSELILFTCLQDSWKPWLNNICEILLILIHMKRVLKTNTMLRTS